MGKTRLASHTIEMSVPFHDLDPLQVVWHGNYLKYFDIARFALFNHCGVDLHAYSQRSGFLFPVTRTSTKHIRPLRYRDRFTITPQWLLVGDTSNGRKKASSVLPQQCTVAMTAPDRCTTSGYSLVNLHLGWHRLLDGNASLWLDIENLFDRRYRVAHGSASRTFWDMPQQPRSWTVSLEYRF